MTPSDFPDSNSVFGPPPGLEESQCLSIPAYVGEVRGGSCDGLRHVIVAWRPSEEELRDLQQGGLVYLSVIGGLAPHYLSTDFHTASHPA